MSCIWIQNDRESVLASKEVNLNIVSSINYPNVGRFFSSLDHCHYLQHDTKIKKQNREGEAVRKKSKKSLQSCKTSPRRLSLWKGCVNLFFLL